MHRHPIRRSWAWPLAAFGCSSAALVLTAGEALGCGCFSPPVSEDDFAVNQQAEQIIFESKDGFVTAHVMIRYAGAPDQFAWLLPIPSIPELALSDELVFALLDEATLPVVRNSYEYICPDPEFVCERHPPPSGCNDYINSNTGDGDYDDDDSAGDYSSSDDDSSDDDAQDEGEADDFGVTVVARERIGAYETVTFDADDSEGAVAWLREEGFIINETMTPFMQPYLDADMLFIASKLVPGAGVDQIRPLKLRYEDDRPMIPIQLTAVAAEPHLMITAFIYGDEPFVPYNAGLLELDETEVAYQDNRFNYPMLLSRSVDEANSRAFVLEYSGTPPAISIGNDRCCGSENDDCNLAEDGQCQCPTRDFDESDCAQEESLSQALKDIEELSQYSTLTRLST